MRCTTQLGSTVLGAMLRNPLHPEEMNRIQNRQAIIRALSENPELLAKIKTLLESARDHESSANGLFGATSPGAAFEQIEPLLNKKFFAALRWLNATRIGIIAGGTYSMCAFLGSGAAAALLTKNAIMHLRMEQLSQARAHVKGILFSFGMTGIQSLSLYANTKMSQNLKTQVNALEQLFAIGKSLEKLIMRNNLSTECRLQNIDKEAVKALQHDYLSRILPSLLNPTAHQVYALKKTIAHLFAFIGEIDAYHSVAQRIAGSQSGNNSFCFSQFKADAAPHIAMKDFWNVLVKDAVPNNISESKNMILTGANAGGKTTAIRAILQNLALSQSLGIAAAKECSITPFSAIHSYINVSDDLKAGLSLFASEIKRAKEIAEKIRSLKHDEKFFFALDELFTGTNAEDGSECAYNFIKALSENPKTQCIYATHFKQLTELADQKMSAVSTTPLAHHQNSLMDHCAIRLH